MMLIETADSRGPEESTLLLEKCALLTGVSRVSDSLAIGPLSPGMRASVHGIGGGGKSSWRPASHQKHATEYFRHACREAEKNKRDETTVEERKRDEPLRRKRTAPNAIDETTTWMEIWRSRLHGSWFLEHLRVFYYSYFSDFDRVIQLYLSFCGVRCYGTPVQSSYFFC